MRTLFVALAVGFLPACAAAQDSLPTSPAPTRAMPGATETGVMAALKLTTAPKVEPSVERGQALITASVTYAHTGVLRSEVKERGLWGVYIPTSQPIPAGTPVFALPMSSPGAIFQSMKRAQVVWCAVLEDRATPDRAPTWKITCFPKVGAYHRFVSLGRDIFPASLAWNNANLSTAPEVEEKPVELALPLKIVIRFEGWSDKFANLRVIAMQPGHYPFGSTPALPEQTLGRPSLQRDAAGVAHLRLFGGEITIRPGADGKSAVNEIAQPFEIVSVSAGRG